MPKILKKIFFIFLFFASTSLYAITIYGVGGGISSATSGPIANPSLDEFFSSISQSMTVAQLKGLIAIYANASGLKIDSAKLSNALTQIDADLIDGLKALNSKQDIDSFLLSKFSEAITQNSNSGSSNSAQNSNCPDANSATLIAKAPNVNDPDPDTYSIYQLNLPLSCLETAKTICKHDGLSVTPQQSSDLSGVAQRSPSLYAALSIYSSAIYNGTFINANANCLTYTSALPNENGDTPDGTYSCNDSTVQFILCE